MDRFRHALTVVTVAIAIFMTNLDTSIVNIALPTLARYFQADTDEVSRVVLAYLLSMVCLVLVFGKVSDRVGHEKIFLAGYAVFTVASALCAFAPGLLLLVLSRFIQGIGSAMLLATWGAIAVKYLPAEIRGRAFGIVTVFGGVGMAIGAPVGGLLLSWLSWKWIFLINVPAGILAILLIRLLFKTGSREHRPEEKFDYAGSLLSLVAFFCLFLLLNTGQDNGWLSWRSLLLSGATLVSFTGFIIRERSFRFPILDLDLLRKRHLLFGFITTLTVTMILMGFNFLFPFFFDLVRHLDPGRTGLLLMTFPLISVLVSPLSGYFSDKSGPRRVSLIALALLILSTCGILFFGVHTPYWFVVLAFLFFGTGLALFFTANTSLIMSHSVPGRESMLSASIATVSYLGSAIGIVLFENIFSFRFPATGGREIMDTIPAGIVVSGFIHASVFGIILALAGFLTTLLSGENRPVPSPGK
jgi:EmrB/QacA subfamily drug resistance transporter